jgi:hypothetical protein
VKQPMAVLGFEPVANTPEEFAARIEAEIPKWGKVIRDAISKPSGDSLPTAKHQLSRPCSPAWRRPAGSHGFHPPLPYGRVMISSR